MESSSNPTLVSMVFENHSDACIRHYSSNNTVTYSNCTLKDSQYGIRYNTPNMDIINNANITFENNVANIVVPGGDITENHIWDSNTYAILGNIRVGKSGEFIRLVLSPGSTLKFAANTNMQISYDSFYSYYGELNAQGTEDQSITFTSLNGEVGGWNGLYFHDYSDKLTGQESVLQHCFIEKGNEYNLYMDNTNQPALIENCAFSNSASDGVYLYNSNSTFSNCVFEDNAQYPLYYNNAHYVGVLEDLTITGNLLDGVVVNGGDIEANRTWNAYTYYILENLYVGGYYGNYNTYHYGLTLLPGTTLKFAEGIRMSIGEGYYNCGHLHALGTVEQPITFTSMNGEAGGWNGLYFGDYADQATEQESVLQYCIVDQY